MLPYENNQEKQRKRQDLLNPPGSMLNVVSLVRRVSPNAVPSRAGAFLSSIAARRRGGQHGIVLRMRESHDQSRSDRRAMLFLPGLLLLLRGTDDPNRNLTVIVNCVRGWMAVVVRRAGRKDAGIFQ